MEWNDGDSKIMTEIIIENFDNWKNLLSEIASKAMMILSDKELKINETI